MLGANLSTQVVEPDTSFAPESYAAALDTLVSPVLLANIGARPTQVSYNLTTHAPAAIPPLAEYLEMAFYASSFTFANRSRLVAPYDGGIIAVSPDLPEIHTLVEGMLKRIGCPYVVTPTAEQIGARECARRALGSGGCDLADLADLADGPAEQPAGWGLGWDEAPGARAARNRRGHTARAAFAANDAAAAAAANRTLTLTYYNSSESADTEAKHGRHMWAAISFDDGSSGPWTPGSNWSYTLSFNSSAITSTKMLEDKFAAGLSHKFVTYYASGFLSLQTALDEQIMIEEDVPGTNHGLGFFSYGMPFPVPAYAHNTFLDHAGSLVGLVVVLSFLVPVSTMLRSLVLEKETKLRESLLMGGTSLSSYYSSLLVTFGLAFVVIAMISAMEVSGATFKHSDVSLIIVFFALFALAALGFTVALSPFFRNARVAAVLGPLALFISTQFINAFLDGTTGVLVQGNAGGKYAVSLLPVMAFSLGANRLALYEGAEKGVTWASLNDGAEGDFTFGASLVMLALDILLYFSLAWYLDQVCDHICNHIRNHILLYFSLAWYLDQV